MRLLFLFIYLLFFSGLRGQSYHQLTDLPTLYIEVYNGDDIVSKENYIDAKIVYVDGKDIRQYENTQVGEIGAFPPSLGRRNPPIQS